jgi:GTP-binding protein
MAKGRSEGRPFFALGYNEASMPRRKLPVVAIVGRPNVGKSTLFNRLVGKRLAIVDELSGVTRDRIYEEAEWGEGRFVVVDCGGIGRESDDPLRDLVTANAEQAAREADAVIFVVDGRVPPTTSDDAVCALLRKLGKPVIVAVNKVDGPSFEADANLYFKLGFKTVIPVGALAGRAINELLDAVVSVLPLPTEEVAGGEGEAAPIVISLIGRQNVGKSSIANALQHVERSLVSPLPGTTRDPIFADFEWRGQPFTVVDTAGVKRLSRTQGVDYYARIRSLKSLSASFAAVLVLDASEGIIEMDKIVAREIGEAGKAVAIAVNKMDLMPDTGAERDRLMNAVRVEMNRLSFAPVAFTSAVTGAGLDDLLTFVVEGVKAYERRIDAAALTEVIDEETTVTPPPVVAGEALRMYSIKQVGIRPPTFVMTINRKRCLHFSYRQFLENAIRRHFNLWGTFIRLDFVEKAARKKLKGGKRK